MPITENARLTEQAKIVLALSNTVPNSTSPKRVDMKAYERCTITISALNGQTVTGSAITLLQDTDIADAGGAEKAVAFTQVFLNNSTTANDTLVATTVSSNTFTLASTSGVSIQAIIEVTPDMLDIANGFDCLRVGTANATAQTITVEMILWPAKYGITTASMISAETN